MNHKLAIATIDDLIDLMSVVPEVSGTALESVNRFRSTWDKSATRLRHCGPDEAGTALEILLPRVEEVKALLNLLTSQLGILYRDLLRASELVRDADNLPAKLRADLGAVIGAMQPLINLRLESNVVNLAEARRRRLSADHAIDNIIAQSLKNCQRILGFVSVLDRAIDAIEALGEAEPAQRPKSIFQAYA